MDRRTEMNHIDPLVTTQLKEFDKLVRHYASMEHPDGDWYDNTIPNDELEQRRREYSRYCRRKAGAEEGDRFEGLSESVLKCVKYREMRESIRLCLDMWHTIIDSGYDDVKLFTL